MSGSIQKTAAGTYQVRYRDRSGKQHTKTHKRRREAEQWLAEKTAEMVHGRHVGPAAERTTVGEWATTWLRGYAAGRRPSTVRQASTHLTRIRARFGDWPLAAVRPSDVREWVADLEEEGLERSYVYALHTRFSQLYSDANHDGLTARNPCSRRTSPPAAQQRPFVCTREQVDLLEAAMPEHLKPAILLGAWLGLRVGEVCGLRSSDLDPDARTLRVEAQWTGDELKTGSSRATFSLGTILGDRLAAIHDPDREWLLVNQWGDQLQPRVALGCRGRVLRRPRHATRPETAPCRRSHVVSVAHGTRTEERGHERELAGRGGHGLDSGGGLRLDQPAPRQ